ncbi:GNAT family N-acetyltransferase [Streptomyces sp. NPDC048595]|uniref:GNAT family N-acetyltransferase n=1 Tax=Streptomyces sp. NPDC048595 TaxID=3365576 RepID=UPI00371807A6
MTLPEVAGIASPAGAHSRYTLSLARHERDVQAAQRLRHHVFVEESGARLSSPVVGHDIDGFDEHCDHLLAHEAETGSLVGTCRLLPPKGAGAAGRLVAEADFDLSAHARIHGDLLEISRACIHPAHRGGTLVPLMTLGLARYALQTGLGWVGGDCLVPLGERGESASAVGRSVAPRHLSPEEYRVSPHIPLRRTRTAAPPASYVIPPLVRGALSLGAWVCGEPGYSPRFDTAVLYVLMPMHRVDPALLRDLPDLSRL